MRDMHRRVAAAAVLLLAGLAVAAATAITQQDDRFGTPAVQPGDRWLYEATGAVPAETPYRLEGDWSVGKLAFQAGPAASGMDRLGQERSGRQLDEVREFRFGREDPASIPVRSSHLVDGPETVATVTAWPRGGGTATNSVILPNGQEIRSGDRHVIRETAVGFGLASPLCGSLHDRQGAAAPVGDPVTVHGACGAWDGPDRTAALAHQGGRTWRDRAVQAYGGGDAEDVEVWLDAAVPVPVLVRVGGATFELAGYEAAAVPAPMPFAIHVVPAVAFAPRGVAGPDEAGVEHPFPLSRAFAAAEADEGSGLRAYLAAHPSAQVVAASFEELVKDEAAQRTWTQRWTFTSSDGASAHGVRSDLVLAGPPGAPRPLVPLTLPPLPPAPQPSPYPAPVQGAVQRLEAAPTDAVPGPWPAPGELPQEMPTAASLLARWEAYKAEGRGAGNAWGFSAACGAESCKGGEWHAWAGLSRTTWPNEAGVTLAYVATQEPEASTVEVDGRGATVAHREVGLLREEVPAEMRVPGMQATSGPAAARDALALASLPAPGVAAGALATLAAALVLAWPWLKAGGPFALFSRLAGGRILENPRRAALLDLIEAEPGIHLRELARRLGLGEGALRHHLSALQAAGRVRAVRGPRYSCYFPAGAGGVAVDRAVASAAPLLKSTVARRLLQRCAAQPGLSGQQLAADLGVTPGAVTYHVRRLSAAGLLQQRRLGRERLVDVTPLGRAAV